MSARLVPVIKLACTACQLVYTPDPAAFSTGNTGCPRCGGWTWIAELGLAEWSVVASTDRSVPPQRTFGDARPDPAVTPPRTAAGSASPTTRK